MSKLSGETNPLFFMAIKANAVFSAFCGIAMIFFSNEINVFMQAEVNIGLTGIGVFLVLFALWLAYIISTNTVRKLDAWAIVIGDFIWVLFTELLISFYTQDFSIAGLFLIGFTGVVVGIFAGMQTISLIKEPRMKQVSS